MKTHHSSLVAHHLLRKFILHPSSFILFCCLGLASPALGQSPNLPPDKNATKLPPFLNRNRAAYRVYARLMQLEDQRNFNEEEFRSYLMSSHAGVRRRTAVTVGRIGDPRGLLMLLDLMQDDGNPSVRAAAAFGVGEIEDLRALDRLTEVLKNSKETPAVRGCAVEAFGKVLGNAANARTLDKSATDKARAFLISLLPPAKTPFKSGSDDESFVALTATALMRAKATNAAAPLVGLLDSPSVEIRRHAANAVSRLAPIAPESSEVKSVGPRLIEALKDDDALVRALVVRALGALRPAEAVEPLGDLLKDKNEHVRINTIRALGRSGDAKVVPALVAAGDEALKVFLKIPAGERAQGDGLPYLLEIASALGNLKTPAGIPFLKQLRRAPTGHVGANPEIEIALAQIDPKAFGDFTASESPTAKQWQATAGLAAGLGELTGADAAQATVTLLDMLAGKRFGELDARAVPDVLRALAKHKPERLAETLRTHLKASDVIVRATAAELLGETEPSDESFKALSAALSASAPDSMNDAKLAILTSLGRYNRSETAGVLASVLRDPDYLVRRQAADLLKTLNPDPTKTAEIEARVGIVRTDRDLKFYQQIVRRLDSTVRAVLKTTKGTIRLELFPDDAPLTVESFTTLAENGFFDGLTFHRVVPNFVVQGGDPRGDGNGGPGYQIRCEINRKRYDRGAVGMALSGKDTGGSQFFICHSPQPHLDGGYTVFGRVTEGMDTVDRITRGDRILEIVIQR